jgi:hypothetical protein
MDGFEPMEDEATEVREATEVDEPWARMEEGLEVAREETSGWVAESIEGGRAFVVWTKAEEMEVEGEDEAASAFESRAWMDSSELLRREPVEDVFAVGGAAGARDDGGVVRRGPVC